MNLLARHTGPYLNRQIATHAQYANLSESLMLAGLWARVAATYRGGPDYPVYRARAYAFLARACELDEIQQRDTWAQIFLAELAPFCRRGSRRKDR